MTSKALTTLSILGFRGFAECGVLKFAVPNGKPGSGLTILVGENNAGKSTIVEAIQAIIRNHEVSFTQGRRNQAAGDRVSISLTRADGRTFELTSVGAGNSETARTANAYNDLKHVMVVPSRRHFAPFFARSEADRAAYMTHEGFQTQRTVSGGSFSYRLFTAQKNRPAFDEVMSRVIDPPPNWAIDQHDTGQYFLKFSLPGGSHSSEGLGDGIISLLFIVDSLYDSVPGDVVVFDEPELSLHPQLLRRLAALFLEYSATRQIVISTHSPYFVSLEAIENGAEVARVSKMTSSCALSQLSEPSRERIRGLLKNDNNPHLLGTDAREAFFLADGVVLLEGQEDVVFYPRIERSLGIKIAGSMFGWGVGGAGNLSTLCGVLRDLGFARVVGVVDGDKATLLGALRAKFPKYEFHAIPARDVRTKRARPAGSAVPGLLEDDNLSVRAEHVEATREIFSRINAYLRPT